jgi:tRNA nucleotidyltransferase (CCA-adding enzyme)
MPLSNFEISEHCRHLIRCIQEAGGKAILVGGCVRDILLERRIQDFDIEVFGLAPKEVLVILKKCFEDIDLSGYKFGVFKLTSCCIDVSIPRIEKVTGHKHTAFEVQAAPFITYKEAAQRRDFTINSMGIDCTSGTLLDPFGGADDLKAGILKHVSSHFFEDPLRVLRGMQLIGRFHLNPHPHTCNMCQMMSPENLSRRKVFDEFKKLFVGSKNPSRGFLFLQQINWLQYFEPWHQCQQKFPDQWNAILRTLDHCDISGDSNRIAWMCTTLWRQLEGMHIECRNFFRQWVYDEALFRQILSNVTSFANKEVD